MKGKMIKQNSFAFLIVLMLFFVGCLPIPTFPIARKSRFYKKDIKRIQVGSTTKADVYDLLGKPNFLENDRYCVYDVEGWYGSLEEFFPTEIYRILLEFDKNYKVINYEVDEGVLTNASHYGVGYYLKTAISPNGKTLAVLNHYGKLFLINLENKEKVECKRKVVSGNEYLLHTKLRFSPDSRHLFVISDQIVVIDVLNPSEALLFKRRGGSLFLAWNPKKVTCFAFFPDEKKVATGESGGFIKIWDLSTGTEIMNLKTREKKIDSIEISPDGKFIATGSSATIRIFDSTTGSELYHMISKIDHFTYPYIYFHPRIYKQCLFKFSPDGKLFAVNRGTHVELWSINRDRDDIVIDAKSILKGLVDVFLLPVFDEGAVDRFQPMLDFSNDSKIIAASYGSAVVYNLQNRQILWSYNYKSSPDLRLVEYALLHPNGKLLYIYTDVEGVSLVKLDQKVSIREILH